MENTGLLPDPRTPEQKSRDYVLGSETSLDVVLRTTEWKPYLSVGIPQYVPGKFDTMSCVSFATDQQFEPQMNFDFESYAPELKQWLTDNGYVQNGKIVLSKRFLAIASGTTPQGNYFWKVYEAARKVGLIPDSDLPMGGNTTEEYLSAPLTKAMLTKAAEFLKRFQISYQLVNGYDGNMGFSPVEITNTKQALKTCPLVVGIPMTTSHAILMYDIRDTEYDALDHYIPYLRTNNAVTVPVSMAYMGYIRPVPAPVAPKIHLEKDLRAGDSGKDVVILQDLLKLEKVFPSSVASTGLFGPITKEAVIKLQEKYAEEILHPLGLVFGTGLCGKSTRAFINQKYG